MLDSIFYIGGSLLYITSVFPKHKDELKYLLFSIMVLCPVVWCYDYTHIDWTCLRAGVYLLVLIMLHAKEWD
jgi:hypothetical protein